MFIEVIQPRFSETDALGHINNTVIPNWFEKAREPLFRFFTPDLDPKKWQLIIARIEVDFKAEIFYSADVTIKTWLEKIGTSSMSVVQQVWQNDRICAAGRAALIHFDWQEKIPKPIPDSIKSLLLEHVQPLLIRLSFTNRTHKILLRLAGRNSLEPLKLALKALSCGLPLT